MIKIDGKESFAKLLNTGDTKVVDSCHPMRFQDGNDGGIEVLSNGKAVKSLGRKGQVRIFEVTAEGFHFVPL